MNKRHFRETERWRDKHRQSIKRLYAFQKFTKIIDRNPHLLGDS